MNEVKSFTVMYKSGVSWVADSKTLMGVKKEATKNACVGYGYIYILETGASDPISVKYESDNKWTNV